jgi:heme exporter protein A
MSQPASLPPLDLGVADLAVRRGGRTLFAGLAFAVPPGGCLLLRGPNGVGKSSLLLTLAGVVRPEAGRIALAGIDGDAHEKHLHFLGHQTGVKGRLSLAENLAFWRDLLGRPGVSPEAALEETGLGGLGRLDAGYLSAGQTRRLALARLLVAERPLWLLDEPTASLDAAGEKLVARLIDAHCARGGLVVAATHLDIPLAAPVMTLEIGGPA